MDEEEMLPEMQGKKWSHGYLYILDYGDGKQFKIGITTKAPKTRADAIKRNSGTLLPLPINSELIISLEMHTNPYYMEQLLHMQLAHKHAGGEWFEFDDISEVAEIVAMIEPFGYLEYFDRWYKLFESDDVFLFVHSGVYPRGLEYVKGIGSYASTDRVYVRGHRDTDENTITEWENKTRKNFSKYKVTGSFEDFFTFKYKQMRQELGL
jgi:hypothetical protein